MSSNGSYNLNAERELRYIVQWFEEWSDLQREDFVPYLVSYMLPRKEASAVYLNGIVSEVSPPIDLGASPDKPMSLFQCRVKLFDEWYTKWPTEFKPRLMEQLERIDSTFCSRIKAEMTPIKDSNEVTSKTGVLGDEPIDALVRMIIGCGNREEGN